MTPLVKRAALRSLKLARTRSNRDDAITALHVAWHFGQAEREREGGVLPNIQAVMLLKKTETSDKA